MNCLESLTVVWYGFSGHLLGTAKWTILVLLLGGIGLITFEVQLFVIFLLAFKMLSLLVKSGCLYVILCVSIFWHGRVAGCR